jgi:hypothetical protein
MVCFRCPINLGSHVTCIIVATNVICLVGASISWLLSLQLVSRQWLYQRRLHVFIVTSVMSTSVARRLVGNGDIVGERSRKQTKNHPTITQEQYEDALTVWIQSLPTPSGGGRRRVGVDRTWSPSNHR